MIDNKEDKIKSVLYTRVSTDRDEQTTSFEQQQKYNDDRFEIIKVFDDRASGTSINKRAGLIDMLSFLGIDVIFEKDDYIFRRVEETNIKVVIISSTSRLGRNIKDVQRIMDILHKHGVKLYFADINSYSDNEQIEILLNIYFTLDQQYSKNLSKSVKFGMKRLEENENHIFCTGTIKGYNLKGGKLSKNEESPMILNIYNDYVYNDISIRSLAIKYGLNQSTIGSILKNKKYAGYNHKEDLETNPNIEPIITLELYNKAQEIRFSRRQKNGRGEIIGAKTNTYGLSSKCICPICGCKLAYRRDKNKKYGMWSCYTSEARARKGVICSNPAISENRINKWILEKIKEDYFRKNIKFEIKKQLKNIHAVDTEILKLNIDEVNKKVDKLLDLYLNDEINKDTYIKRKDILQIELDKLQDNLNHALDINSRIKELEALKHTYMSVIDKFESYMINKEYQKAHKMISKVEFMNITNIRTFKKQLHVKNISFKDIPIDEYYPIFKDEIE